VIGRRHADVITPVRIVAIALDLLRGDDDPFAVFPSPSEQRFSHVLDFGRIAILFVAAALGGLIGHEPRAVELLMKLRVLRRMVMMLSLSRKRHDKKANEQKCTKGTHDELPIKGRMSAIN